MAWGIDIETGMFARRDGRSVYVHDGVRIKKETNVGYKLDRMGMTAEDREKRAGEQMIKVLTDKYGPNAWEMVNNFWWDGPRHDEE